MSKKPEEPKVLSFGQFMGKHHPKPSRWALDKQEQRVYAAVKVAKRATTDRIMGITGLPHRTVKEAIDGLQMQGRIKGKVGGQGKWVWVLIT